MMSCACAHHGEGRISPCRQHQAWAEHERSEAVRCALQVGETALAEARERISALERALVDMILNARATTGGAR
jgi:hypothetical protein